MNYFGYLAVFFHFEQMFCLPKDIAAYPLLPYNIRTQGGQLLLTGSPNKFQFKKI